MKLLEPDIFGSSIFMMGGPLKSIRLDRFGHYTMTRIDAKMLYDEISMIETSQILGCMLLALLLLGYFNCLLFIFVFQGGGIDRNSLSVCAWVCIVCS